MGATRWLRWWQRQKLYLCTALAIFSPWLALNPLNLYASEAPWSFALIGDTPYSKREVQQLPAMLQEIKAAGAKFIIHIGDLKSSATPCSDTVLQQRFTLLNQSPLPLVYAPGDNEWTDCNRLRAGGYPPEERLAYLRKLFWSTPYSLGQQRLRLTQQNQDYPEHRRWQVGSLLFVSLNIPGGGNNWGWLTTPSAEFQRRQPHVLAWIKDSFALAQGQKLAGIVFAFQADPALEHYSKGLGHSGYREFLDTIFSLSQTFPGKVALLHGDTHQYRLTHPLRDNQGQPHPNLLRIESYGYPFLGWVHIQVNPQHPDLFTVTGHPNSEGVEF